MLVPKSLCCKSAILLGLACAALPLSAAPAAEDPWLTPPPEARLRAYWWWLNGNVDKPAITRDLEQMKAKGFGGAVIFDADGSSQGGHVKVPAGPTFGTPAWCELFAHTVREAARLDLELSLNIQSGWNLGGPPVTAEDAVKRITWSEVILDGGKAISQQLPSPPATDGFYRDTVTVALPIKSTTQKSLRDWRMRALHEKLKLPGNASWADSASAPPTVSLLSLEPEDANEPVVQSTEVINLASHLTSGGVLDWQAPPGKWKVLRFGMTLGTSNKVSTASGAWQGYALDPLDEGAFSRYWDRVIDPILASAGNLVGKSLKYLHTDSWEVEVFNWTPSLIGEFKQRRGYDMIPWLPALTGNVIISRDASQRFLADFRKTLGDLAIDHHYRPFLERAAKRGLGIHPEAGGPHYTTIDAQRALGFTTIPTSEFWAESATHRVTDSTRFFIKQPASAAHTYGKPVVAAEGFTCIGPQWQETLWDNLKPSFDMACTEGVNRLIWHAFVCSPAAMGVPGQQYFAGTHLNPNVTWWERSQPFFTYLNRCQWMLQQGLFRADALAYYGDHVPNFAQSRSSDPAKLGRGYDYDVATEEVLLNRLSVKDGRLVLPDGMSYRILTLPDYPSISMPVLRKLKQLVAAGATIVGARPQRPASLEGYPKTDGELRDITEALWSGNLANGRVIADRSARQVLEADGIGPDFSCSGAAAPEAIRYIHRGSADAEVYFVANRAKTPVTLNASFRITGRSPELWNAVTGERSPAANAVESNGTTSLPLALPACGSIFVVFGKPTEHQAPATKPATQVAETAISTPWSVTFNPKSGGPDSAVTFDSLTDWSQHADPRIKYYSGTAIYRNTLQATAPAAGESTILDLGLAREIATVKLNGKPLGTLWAPPFQLDITRALVPGANPLEIEIVNFWPNRIIGDASLPESQRHTRTNIRTLTTKTPLMPSGLLGPVRILRMQAAN
ncbi:MAG: glycosyl hydrolase [Verrucomicrobiota bacterium]